MTETSQKRFGWIVTLVGGEDADALMLLHLREQIVRFQIGVSVVTVLNIAAFAEQRVRFIKNQYYIGFRGTFEYPVDVLFRLADVLADDTIQIDLKHIGASRSGK
jgi:hypothetical protein